VSTVDKIDVAVGHGAGVIRPEEVAGEPEVKARGYWELVWIRFRRDKVAVASLFFVVFLFISAFLLAPVFSWWLGHGPNDIFGGGVVNYTPVGPWTHIVTSPYPGAPGHFAVQLLPLGADGALGRDLFLRLLYGARASLEVAVFATVLSVGIGIIAGLMAGYFRGWVDTVVSRLTEMVMVFPALLFIIAIRVTAGDTLNGITFGGALARGVFTLTLIFAVFGWFYPGRIIRGVVLSLREKEFVEAARMTGAGDWRIMRSHLLPHLVAPVIVYSTLIVAQTIIAEAGLSFLGLGIELPTASWGNLLQSARDWYIQQPWLMVWPGLAILLTTLAFNLLGDGLRDAFDPRARI
jgi:peptide/nickel transport system permease protein/oligopeptide transport system permease protein